MEPVYVVAIAAVLLVSYAVIRRLDGEAFALGDRLRSRLLLGIPWGTLVTLAFVAFVYFIIQDARTDLHNPVRIAFQSWSYTYPTGWLVGGFAHADYSHFFSNMTAAIVLGSVAEYAWGHYPRRRGAHTFASWRTNPYVRAFLIFPAAAIAIGLFTSLFALGPVIGFSGVVFAFAGFALVRYPIGTVLALVGYRVLRRLIEAILSPQVTAGITAPAPSPPWWAEIAIQGHAIGLIAGVFLGLYVFRRRNAIPPAWRLWTGVVMFGVLQSLWAVYWFEGADRFILLQGIGMVLVVALAILVAAAVAGSSRSLAWRISSRQAAIVLLAFGLAAMIGPAIAVNLIAPDPGAADEHPGVEVADYRVIYAEDITNRMVAVGDIDIAGLGDVRTSGVIVVSEERNIWSRQISAQRLADRGSGTVTLGGIGWRESVDVDRDTWRVAGNDSVYQVWLEGPDQRVHAFASEQSTADVRVANRTVTVLIEDEAFAVAVDHNDERVGQVTMPADNETADVGGITLKRLEDDLFVQHDGTKVRVGLYDG